MAKNQVTLTFAGDSAQLERAVKRAGDSTEKLTRQVGQANDNLKRSNESLTGSLLKVGAGLTAAFAAGSAIINTVADLGGEIFKLSRTMVDLDHKSSAVFEDQLPSITKWAEANRKAFGLSSREVVGLAANMADLLKPMGFTAKQAADMSMKTLNLAGALAKWSGGTRTAAQVADILTSAMLGERDMLKGLGISISDADVKARLLAKGQQNLTGVAEEQAIALATQELIFEKSTDAQKAWADGGKDAAEKQGALSSAIDTIKEKVAKLLTPAFEAATTTVATWADQLLVKFDEVAPKVQSFVDNELSGMKTSLIDLKDNILVGVRNGFDDIKISIDTNADSWRELAEAISTIVKYVGPVVKWLAEIIAISIGAALDWVATLIDAVATLVGWLRTAWDWLWKIGHGGDRGNVTSSVSGILPQTGGSVADLLHFHSGGVVPGLPGQEVLAVLQSGETVTPAGQSDSSGTTVIVYVDGVKAVQKHVKANGGNVQVALGR